MTHYLSHSWRCEKKSFTAHPDECYYCSQPGDLTLCLIGDVYTSRVQNVLENCKPYPGDEILGTGFESSDQKRFSVYSDENYFVIFDHSMDLKSHLHITRLYSADFSIAQWYVQRCTKIHEFPCPVGHVLQWMTKVESCPTEVGFIVEEQIIEVLTHAIMFFNDPKLVNTNKPHFEVTPIPGNCDNLLLIDQGHDLVTILSRSSLQNPKFNIAEWYKSRLFQVDIDTNVFALEASEPRWASAIATVATLLENR
jgi:hypothetical protein